MYDFSNMSLMGRRNDLVNSLTGYGGSAFTPVMQNPINMGGMPEIASMPTYSPPTGGVMSSFNNWLRDTGVVGTIDKNGMRTDGWGGLALGAASALANGYMGMKQLGMAKEQFNFKKDAWQKEFDMQKSTLNEARFDREQRRRRERSDLYGNPYSSMSEWGAAGKALP